jgi:dienelactone hydrolase
MSQMTGMVAAIATCFALVLGQNPGSKIKVVPAEQFGTNETLPLMILLHGVSGPSAFYREQASFFARHGYRVVLPHYLEAGKGQAATDANYEAWTAAVRNTIDSLQAGHGSPTVIVGFSLGASVALALGSEGNGPDGIAEFYGSLPDKYFRDLKGMPPLLILHGGQDQNIPVYNALQLSRLCVQAGFDCDMHIYSTEGHGFTPEALKDADQRVLQFFETRSALKRQ